MIGIEIDQVSVAVANTTILDGVQLAIPPGGLLAIVGPNGSGKTTLLRTMYQALRPTSGAVYFDGIDVTRLAASKVAHLRAVVPQFQHGEVALTAAEVVATGRHAHSPWWAVARADDAEQVRVAMERADAAALADRMFGTLSGGERQRVLLARALAQQAATLLLDEPTNHLDARSQLSLLEMLAALPVTRVAVLHDLDRALAYADAIAVLKDGRLVASGAPADVLSNDLTTAVFGLRSKVVQHELTGRLHLLTAPL